ACKFDVRMTVRDVNEFVDGYEHEAQLKGVITFGEFEGQSPATFTLDDSASVFHYLRVNAQTDEAEMRYHLEFLNSAGQRYTFDGTKYMQKDGGPPVRDLLGDYTTLYCHVRKQAADGSAQEIGIAYLRFRTFENLAAVSNLAGFLASFQVTGTTDPVTQFQA